MTHVVTLLGQTVELQQNIAGGYSASVGHGRFLTATIYSFNKVWLSDVRFLGNLVASGGDSTPAGAAALANRAADELLAELRALVDPGLKFGA